MASVNKGVATNMYKHIYLLSLFKCGIWGSARLRCRTVQIGMMRLDTPPYIHKTYVSLELAGPKNNNLLIVAPHCAARTKQAGLDDGVVAMVVYSGWSPRSAHACTYVAVARVHTHVGYNSQSVTQKRKKRKKNVRTCFALWYTQTGVEPCMDCIVTTCGNVTTPRRGTRQSAPRLWHAIVRRTPAAK